MDMAQKQQKKRQAGLRTGVLILTLANIFVKIMGFAYKVPLNAVLGDEMANVNAAYAIYALLYTVSTAGIPGAVALSVARARAEQNGKKIRRLFDATLSLLLSVGFVLSLLLLLLSRPLSVLGTGGDSFLCTVAIAPALFFTAATSVFRGFFQGFSLLMPTAVSELFEAIGKTLFGLALALLSLYAFGKSTAIAAALAVFGITLGVMMGALFLAVYYKKHAQALLTPLAKESTVTPRRRSVYRAVLSVALPIALTSAFMSLSGLIDAQLMRPLLASHYGSEMLAKSLYSDYSTGALTLYNLPSVLITPIATALIPYVSGAFACGEQKRARAVTSSAFKLASLLSLPCAAGLFVLAKPILSFVFQSDTDMAENAGSSLSVLAICVFLIALLTVSTAALQAVKKEKMPIVSLGVGIGAKLLFMPLFVHVFGTVGVPLATLAFYAVSVILNFVFLYRSDTLHFRLFDGFLRPLFCAMLCGGAAYVSYISFSRSLPLSAALLLSVLVAALFYFAFLVLTRAVGREELSLLPFGRKVVGKLEILFKV